MHRITAFVLAAGPAKKSGETYEPKPLQRAPQYFGESVPRQSIITQEGDILLKTYPPNVLLAEVTRTVTDVFSQEAFGLRERMVEECGSILEKHGGNLKLSEEYAVAIIDHYTGDPEQFLRHEAAIAGFLKSESLALDEKEIAYTLESQLKYAKDDLLILDWDGAFLFDPTGEVQSTIELFELANLQLLQHRILDLELDQRLRKMEHLVQTKTVTHVVFWNRELSRAYREVIRMRTRSIMEFDAIVREIKLIGDWYSARLYELTARKFRLDEWRRSIKEKLSTLEDIYDIISQNFHISRESLFDFLLQLGWFTLLLLELYLIFR